MKNYILTDDIECRYFARNKQDLIDYIKENMKKPYEYGYIENVKDLEIRTIEYNAKKIDIDDFFGDIIAIDKKTDESIEYDNYSKYGIVDGVLKKKDFLYHNL